MHRLVLPFLSCLLVAGTAVAREGDRDPRFAGDGDYTVAIDSNTGTSKRDRALRTLVDSKHRYVMVGQADSNRIGLARLRSDGSPDPAFAGGGIVDYPIPGNVTLTDAILGQNDSVIVVGYGLNPLDNDPFICRYNANGVPDAAYGTNGCHFLPVDFTSNGDGDDQVEAAAMYGGNLFLAGSVERSTAGDFDFLVMRLFEVDGTLDTGFNDDGYAAVAFDLDSSHAGGDDDHAKTILLIGSTLYLGGYANVGGFNQRDFAMAKMSGSDGTLDAAFCANASACSGSFAYAGKRTYAFDPGSGIYNDEIGALAEMPSGAITVAGETTGSGTSDVVVTTIPPNGNFFLGGGGNEGNRERIHLFDETRLGGLGVRPGNAMITVAGTSAWTPNDPNPLRVLWVAQLYPNFGHNENFASNDGSPSWLTSFTFPRNGDAQPIDHDGGTLAFDRGRILLTGSRLWQRDTGTGLNDFDFAIVRMQGDAIFIDGFDD